MDYNGTSTSYIDKRSASMAIASMVLGIAGMVMSCCIYPAIIFGSLALLLAVLSRGGEMTFSNYAKAGMILGIIAIVCGILFLTISLITIYVEFEGFEGYLEYIEKMLEEMGYPDSYQSYDFYRSL